MKESATIVEKSVTAKPTVGLKAEGSKEKYPRDLKELLILVAHATLVSWMMILSQLSLLHSPAARVLRQCCLEGDLDWKERSPKGEFETVSCRRAIKIPN